MFFLIKPIDFKAILFMFRLKIYYDMGADIPQSIMMMKPNSIIMGTDITRLNSDGG